MKKIWETLVDMAAGLYQARYAAILARQGRHKEARKIYQ